MYLGVCVSIRAGVCVCEGVNIWMRGACVCNAVCMRVEGCPWVGASVSVHRA